MLLISSQNNQTNAILLKRKPSRLQYEDCHQTCDPRRPSPPVRPFRTIFTSSFPSCFFSTHKLFFFQKYRGEAVHWCPPIAAPRKHYQADSRLGYHPRNWHSEEMIFSLRKHLGLLIYCKHRWTSSMLKLAKIGLTLTMMLVPGMFKSPKLPVMVRNHKLLTLHAIRHSIRPMAISLYIAPKKSPVE